MESDVDEVVAALRNDEVVIVPTDTVYGLAANPASKIAMKRLFELKQRPEGVPMAVLAASIHQAQSLVAPSETFDRLAQRHWPGALTMVAATARDVELHIGETANAAGVPTIGVRVPDHDFIRSCAESFGPIAATSANVHGSPTITDPVELTENFSGQVARIVSAGVLSAQASTVIDISGENIEVLRQGVVQVDYLS